MKICGSWIHRLFKMLKWLPNSRSGKNIPSVVCEYLPNVPATFCSTLPKTPLLQPNTHLPIFGCTLPSLLCKPSLVAESWGYFSLWCTGFSCGGFSLWRQALGWAGFSSCGTRAQLLWGIWNLYRPGIKPVSPTLAGRFFSTVPPGKSQPKTLNTIAHAHHQLCPLNIS